jgi:putative transport protein
MLFLAGLGANSGAQLQGVLEQQGGLQLLAAGLAVTFAALLVGLLLAHGVYKMNLLSTLGLLCGTMSSSSALAAAGSKTSTEVPAITYAATMPVVLIFKILAAQILVEVLRLL